jgi:hypothetical protein
MGWKTHVSEDSWLILTMTKDETHKDLYPLLLPSSDRPSFAVLSL